MKESIQKFGRALSGMIMPNIGAFIAWGIITALFIPTGWAPNDGLAALVGPMLTYLLPILVAYQGGKMIGGDRGGVMGAIAVMGVILGAPEIVLSPDESYTPSMLMGAMMMGPLAGLVIKKFDDFMENRMPSGFEMLINNFSVGILSVLMSLSGFFAISPLITAILGVLRTGVNFLLTNGLLPLVAIFIEPAKVLFLNNAINHGIFTPLGTEQVIESAKSIMYMLETNPGPGLGVLLAYMFFSRDKVAKSSAPGAVIIHFFGGIHEIYFPYILMNPAVILAPIAGNAAAIFFYATMDAGLSGPPSPGSIIAFMAMTPPDGMLTSILGVLIATGVSFLIAIPLVRSAAGKSLDEATAESKKLKNKPAAAIDVANLKADASTHIVFSCDAGMGSSALGATKFRNRIKELAPQIKVTNSPVGNVPPTANIVVCQSILQGRARENAPQAQVITIENFLADPNLDALYAMVEKMVANTANPSAAPVAVEAPAETGLNISLTTENVRIGLPSVSKEEAIRAAGQMLVSMGCVEPSYIDGMLAREEVVTTYMGLGVAIPHGTSEAKSAVKRTGLVCMQYPGGVDFGDEPAQLIFGLACKGGEHVDMLAAIADILENDEKLEELKSTKDLNVMLTMFD